MEVAQMAWRHSLTTLLVASAVLPFVILRVGEYGTYKGLDLVSQDQLLHGPYMGQRPPGLVPEIFAPGVVSTAAGEGCIV
jgi:hypothetical protein